MALNVLVVDDSSVMRSMVVRVLRLSGVPLGEIHQAGNGQEALNVVEKNWIDLVMLDLNMPVMNGEEFLRRIRSGDDADDLKVVIVSTESSLTRIKSLMGEGVGFVHKPFSPETLRNVVFDITGVTDEQEMAGGAHADSGPDF